MNSAVKLFPLLAFLLGAPLWSVAAETEEEQPPTPAYLRAWMAFPITNFEQIERHTLQFTGPANNGGGTREGTVFSRRAGYGTTSFSEADFFTTPAGKYTFRLFKEGEGDPERIASLEVELDHAAAYSLLATLDRSTGKPIIRLIQEHPIEAEQHGIYIYNLLPEVPLELRAAQGGRLIVPSSNDPHVLSHEGLEGTTLLFRTLGRRSTTVEFPVEYSGGRLSILFMRNMYNQPMVLPFQSIPALDP